MLKRAASRWKYKRRSKAIKEAAGKEYRNDPEKKKAAARVRLALNRDNIYAQKRAKYALAEPKLDVKDMYVKKIISHLLAAAEARSM